MDSDALACFVKVVACGSIAEAARQLNTAPATIAQRIRTLESGIGCTLIQRTGRTVRPTVAGLLILDHANDILKSVKAIHASASNTDLPPGPLRLGATPTVVAGLLPDVLSAWAQRLPSINIFIEPAITRDLYDKLLSDELDVVILSHPNFALAKTCSWRKLREEELILLTPPDIKAAKALDILASYPFIRYDRRTVAGKMIDDYLLSSGIAVQTRFELDGIYPIMELVARGLGVAILPDSVVIDRVVPAVQKWMLPAPRPKRAIGALWLRASSRSRLAELFVDVTVHHLIKRETTGDIM